MALPPGVAPTSLALSPSDKLAYAALTQRLVHDLVREYDAFARTGHVVSPLEWKLLKEQDGVAVHKERRDRRDMRAPALLNVEGRYETVATCLETPRMLVTGTLPGTVDDVLYGAFVDSTETHRMRSVYLKDRWTDFRVLNQIEGPTETEPFRFCGLTWTLMGDIGVPLVRRRDLLALVATGTTLYNGEKLGYYVVHSVTHQAVPPFTDHKMLRAAGSFCYLFRQWDTDNVEIFQKALFAPKGELPSRSVEAAIVRMLATPRYLADASYGKKLRAMLMYAPQREGEHEDEEEYDESDGEGEGMSRPMMCAAGCARRRRSTATNNSVKGTALSLARRHRRPSHQLQGKCVLCKLPVCGMCKVVTKLAIEAPEPPEPVMVKDLGFCTLCVAKAKALSATLFARQALLEKSGDKMRSVSDLAEKTRGMTITEVVDASPLTPPPVTAPLNTAKRVKRAPPPCPSSRAPTVKQVVRVSPPIVANGTTNKAAAQGPAPPLMPIRVNVKPTRSLMVNQATTGVKTRSSSPPLPRPIHASTKLSTDPPHASGAKRAKPSSPPPPPPSQQNATPTSPPLEPTRATASPPLTPTRLVVKPSSPAARPTMPPPPPPSRTMAPPISPPAVPRRPTTAPPPPPTVVVAKPTSPSAGPKRPATAPPPPPSVVVVKPVSVFVPPRRPAPPSSIAVKVPVSPSVGPSTATPTGTSVKPSLPTSPSRRPSTAPPSPPTNITVKASLPTSPSRRPSTAPPPPPTGASVKPSSPSARPTTAPPPPPTRVIAKPVTSPPSPPVRVMAKPSAPPPPPPIRVQTRPSTAPPPPPNTRKRPPSDGLVLLSPDVTLNVSKSRSGAGSKKRIDEQAAIEGIALRGL